MLSRGGVYCIKKIIKMSNMKFKKEYLKIKNVI